MIGEIYYGNVVTEDNITGTAGQTGFEKENLLDNDLSTVWKPPASLYAYIESDLGTSQNIYGVFIGNIGLSPGDTVIVKGHNGDPNSPVYTHTHTVSEEGENFFLEIAGVSARYWRFSLNADLARELYAGEFRVFSKKYSGHNFNWGYKELIEEKRVKTRTRGGILKWKTLYELKGYSLEYTCVENADWEVFKTIAREGVVVMDIEGGIFEFGLFTIVGGGEKTVCGVNFKATLEVLNK